MRIRRLESLDDSRHVADLGAILVDCVEGGASVNFMHPLSPQRAQAYWRSLAAGISSGERILLVAQEADGTLAGTVQVVAAPAENQPHRADIAKMLVHRRARRRGLGAALMQEAENQARQAGKTLLVLDTVTDLEGARLYARMGWQRCGSIPGFALFPNGGLCETTIYFKHLDS